MRSGGGLAAEYSTAPPEANPTTKWTVTDQLGSPRVLVNSLGEVVSRRDFMPFGEEITPDGTHRTANLKYNFGDNIRQKFTGYQKDEETQLDFAEARMYQNLHGRFTAVDPLLASGKSANPQTFNRYVYVMNNPLIYTDPTGLQAGTYYQDLGDGTWALANYAKSGYTRYTGPPRTGRAPDGTLLRITKRGWRPIDDVVAAKAAKSRSNAAVPSNDTINTPLLNDLGQRGPALLNITTAFAVLMVSPAALPLAPSIAGGTGAVVSACSGLCQGGIGLSFGLGAGYGATRIYPEGSGINVGGILERPDLTSVNNETFQPGANIPNLINADATAIGEIFAPGSANIIVSNRLPISGISDWNQFSQGAYTVLRPGGTINMGVTVNGGVPDSVLDSIRGAGFENVEARPIAGSSWEYRITATRPRDIVLPY